MTAAELFEQLQLLDETERIEAKKASDIGKSILESVCAFANEPDLNGGWLLLGADREESALLPGYMVSGIEQPDQTSADLASQAATTFNVPVRLDIQTEQLDGKAVLVVYVPESAPADKPVYFKAQGLPRGSFRRIGSTDQRCTEDDLAAFYAGRMHESYDAGLLVDASREDLSDEAVADYRKARQQISANAEELGWDDDELLQALGAVRRNSQGQWQPTVTGLILFGRSSALRRLFPMTRVDYIRVAGRDWVSDPDQRFDTLELRDSLLRLIRRTQAAILDDLPKAFGLSEGELQRQDRPVLPDRVVREAVVNALMHRSYRTPAPLQIIRYSNRLEIRNPGFSLKSHEHLGEPGSVPRNPKVAAVLYDTGFAETKGSGIRVMRQLCERAGLAPPLTESDRGQDRFAMRLFFQHFLGKSDLEWLSRFKSLQLSDAEARALVTARELGAIDNAAYRELNSVDTLTASQALQRLRDAELLSQKGKGPSTWYQPTAQLLGDDAAESEPGPLSGESAPLSGNPSALSRESGSLSGNLDSPDNGSNERDKLLAALPGDLGARVGGLGRRAAPDDVNAVLLALLRHQTWRLEQLGLLLGRNPEYLRDHYLRPLMDSGRVVMMHPDTPNAPGQAYRAVAND
jgi:ATP-dependent DNA helicase RecG